MFRRCDTTPISGFWFLVSLGRRRRARTTFLAISVVVKPVVEKIGRFRRFSGEKLLDRSMVLRAYLLIIGVALTQLCTPLIVEYPEGFYTAYRIPYFPNSAQTSRNSFRWDIGTQVGHCDSSPTGRCGIIRPGAPHSRMLSLTSDFQEE